MRLVPNWRAVLLYSWSVRLIGLAAVLSGIEGVLQLAGNFLGWPAGFFALASFATTAAAFVARLVAQRSLTRDAGQ